MGDMVEDITWKYSHRSRDHDTEFQGFYVDSKYVSKSLLDTGLDRDRQLEVLESDISHIHRTIENNASHFIGAEVELLTGKYKGYKAKILSAHLERDMYGKSYLGFFVSIFYKNGTDFISTDFNSSGWARTMYRRKDFKFCDE